MTLILTYVVKVMILSNFALTTKWLFFIVSEIFRLKNLICI